MKEYATKELRNVAIISHSGAGKTTFTEAVLFNLGVINRLGRVEDGTTTSDYDPEEIKRQVSISATTIPVEFNKTKINIIDTPGYFDFVGEVLGAMSATDGAIILVDSVAGVEVGTEKVWEYATKRNLAKLILVNKMDRENANFFNVLDNLRENFGTSVVPMQLPLGKEENFTGVIDLVEKKAYVYAKGDSKKFETKEIPSEFKDDVDTYREMLIESVAETDDELLMKYLDGETLTDEEIINALKMGTASGKIAPVLCTSAIKGIGVQQVLNTIVSCLPAPDFKGEVVGINPKNGEKITRKIDASEPLAVQIFKTVTDPYVGKLSFFKVYSGTFLADSQVYNPEKDESERITKIFTMLGKNQLPLNKVFAGDIGAVAKLQITVTGDTLCDKDNPIILPKIEFPEPLFTRAVELKGDGDEDKIAAGLNKIAEEDPTFRMSKNVETKQLLMQGIGDLQLDVIKERLKRKFGVDVNTSDPRVPYRETIRTSVKVEGKHKKQSGGHGQYGHVWIEMSPLSPGEGFEFTESIFGGAVPKNYIPAVEKGIRESMEEGILAGYPVVDFKVNLYDGSYHPVDSSEMAFKIAASLAFKKGMEQAKPVLLEPIANVEVTVPDAYMGDIIGDINSKRGRVIGMEPKDGMQVVKAQVPLAEMFSYAVDLRSITQGRGSFKMEFSHYEEAPERVAQEVIAKTKAAKAQE